MRKIFNLFIMSIFLFSIFSCSGSNKLVLKVEEHERFSQPLTVPVEYSYIVDVGSVGYKAKLIPHNSYLYIGNLNGYVYEIDPNKKEKYLIAKFDNQPIEASVAVDGNYIFVGTTKGWLYKISIKTKEVTKKRKFDSPIVGGLYIHNGYVYLTLEDDKVYAVDKNNLRVVWAYTHGEPNTLDIRGFSGICFGKDGIYVGFDDGSVDKISYKGDQVWEIDVSEGSMFVDSDTTPVLNGGILYVASTRGYTEAVKANDGSLIWRRKISTYSNIEFNIFGVFVADESGNVYCLDSSGGETVWKRRLTLKGNIYSLKLVDNILFVITSEGKLIALNPVDGKILDIKNISGDFSSNLVMFHNKMFVVSRDGDVYCICSEREK